MEKKNRVMLIGRTSAGKTTLCQYINSEDLVQHKTQTIEIINNQIIDTPGEYLERGPLQGALTVTAADADIILLVQDATEEDSMFPPAYSSTFAKPVVGIVTKSDLATEKNIEDGICFLKMAGAKKIFVTSSISGAGIEELLAYIGIEKG